MHTEGGSGSSNQFSINQQDKRQGSIKKENEKKFIKYRRYREDQVERCICAPYTSLLYGVVSDEYYRQAGSSIHKGEILCSYLLKIKLKKRAVEEKKKQKKQLRMSQCMSQ